MADRWPGVSGSLDVNSLHQSSALWKHHITRATFNSELWKVTKVYASLLSITDSLQVRESSTICWNVARGWVMSAPQRKANIFFLAYMWFGCLKENKALGWRLSTSHKDRCAADVFKWNSYGYHWSGRWRHIALIFHSCSVTDERFQFCLLDQNLVNLWFGDKFGKGGVTLSTLAHSTTSATTKSTSVLAFTLELTAQEREMQRWMCEAVPNLTLC